MLESARIMRRQGNEVNTPARRSLSFFSSTILSTLLLIFAASCGGPERHADRLWRAALERVEAGDTQGAVDRLQKIIDQYPDSAVAEKARAQIVVYRGLIAAAQAYPGRRARELMVQLARAIEAYRIEHGTVPPTLDALVPGKLSAVPLDPWNRPFIYSTTTKGYTLGCLGADGAVGGTAEAADLVVVDGSFSQDPT